MNNKEQLAALAILVSDWAVKRSKAVKGEYTSGDYVTFCLNQIFTPARWQFTILDGPTIVTLNPASAYIRLVGRLTVRFGNGDEAHQDDIGIWPLTATKAREGGVLADTAPERYETAEKAARTDCLKNAARNLGTCFAPLTDLELLAHIKRQAYVESTKDEPKRSAAQDIDELYGGQKPAEPAVEAEQPKQEKGPGAVKIYLNEQASQKAFQIGSSTPSEAQLTLYRLLIDKILGGSLERRTWQKWTFGKESSTAMTKGEVQATLNMLKLNKDIETGYQVPSSDKAVQAIKAMFKQALLDAGQTEMNLEQSVGEVYGT